jgi:hypothetical protein
LRQVDTQIRPLRGGDGGPRDAEIIPLVAPLSPVERGHSGE